MVSVLIQARMGSSRLPGKVMLSVDGRPESPSFLEFQIKRLKQKLPPEWRVGVVTTGRPDDDVIADLCKTIGVYCYRGSVNDLVSRYYNAAIELDSDVIVRITSDCPLVEPEVIVHCVDKLIEGKLDYVSTSEPLPTTFPDGMDVSVFTFDALSRTYSGASLFSEREHVNFYVYAKESGFKYLVINNEKDLSSYRLCLDYPEDYELLKSLFASRSLDQMFDISCSELIELVDCLGLKGLNEKYEFGGGWSSSFEVDEAGVSSNLASKAPPLELSATESLWDRQLKYVPGGAQTFSKMPNAHVSGVAPKLLARGRGAKVWDFDGNEYTDFVLGLGPVILGHSFKRVDDAYHGAARDYFVTPSLAHPIEACLAQLINSVVPSIEMVRYGKNGSDATSGAVRLARAVTGRDLIGCCGYHGWQDWYIGQTPLNLGIPKAVGAMTKQFRYNDIESVERLFSAHPNQVACLIMEPMGAEWPTNNFLHDVKDLCHRNGALLIFDEVVSGFRFSLGGAQAILGVEPDITCFGKAIANGYPISVIGGRSELISRYNEVFYSFTYGGELPAIAAAIETIKFIRDNPVLQHVEALGDKFVSGVNAIVSKMDITYIKAFGHGSWPKYEVSAYAGYEANEILTLLQQELVRRGLLTRTTPFFCYCHSNYDIKLLLDGFRSALGVVNDAVQSHRLHDKIDGEIIRTIIRDENVKH